MAVSRTDIEEGLRLLASLIDLYGDAYWPLFDRLESELATLNSRTERLATFLDAPHSSIRITENIE